MKMNEITGLAEIVGKLKDAASSLPLEMRMKRLMYMFINFKGNPEMMREDESTQIEMSGIGAMMFDIDPEFAKDVYKHDREFEVLRGMGLSEQTIATELIQFSNEMMNQTEFYRKELTNIG
jgi:hypothetical protein